MKQYASKNSRLAGAALIATVILASPLAFARDGGSGPSGHGGPGPSGMGAVAGHGPGSGASAGTGAAMHGHDGMGHDAHDAAGHDAGEMGRAAGDHMRGRHDANDVDGAGHEAKDVNDVDRPHTAATVKKGS